MRTDLRGCCLSCEVCWRNPRETFLITGPPLSTASATASATSLSPLDTLRRAIIVWIHSSLPARPWPSSSSSQSFVRPSCSVSDHEELSNTCWALGLRLNPRAAPLCRSRCQEASPPVCSARCRSPLRTVQRGTDVHFRPGPCLTLGRHFSSSSKLIARMPGHVAVLWPRDRHRHLHAVPRGADLRPGGVLFGRGGADRTDDDGNERGRGGERWEVGCELLETKTFRTLLILSMWQNATHVVDLPGHVTLRPRCSPLSFFQFPRWRCCQE